MAGISYIDWVAESLNYSEFAVTETGSGAVTITLDNLKTPRLKEVSRISGSTIDLRLTCFNPINPVNGRSQMDVGCVFIGGIKPSNSSYLDISISINVYAQGGLLLETKNKIINRYLEEWWLGNDPQSKNSFIKLDSAHDGVERVDISISCSGSSYIDIGRLWVGDYFEIPLEAGWNVGYVTSGNNVSYSRGLDAHPIHNNRRRKGVFNSSLVSYADAFGSYPLDQTLQRNGLIIASKWCGKDSEMIVNYRDTDPDIHTIYGLLDKDMKISHMGGNNFETQISVVELI